MTWQPRISVYRIAVRIAFIGMVLIGLLSGQSSCGAKSNTSAVLGFEDNTAQQPFSGHGTPVLRSTPLLTNTPNVFSFANPSDLAARLVAAASSQIAGDHFESSWPNSRVSAGVDYAQFSPQWSDDSPDNGNISYAIYRLTAPNTAANYSLAFSWGEAEHEYGDLWTGIANFKSDCWNWFPGSASNATAFQAEDHLKSGEIYIIVLCLGTATWKLEQLGLSEAKPGINSITPTTGGSGVVTQFSASITGGNAQEDVYCWDFNGSALYEIVDDLPQPLVNGVSHQALPSVILESVGTYNCEVSVELADGTVLVPYSFRLDVINSNAAPKIISLSPRFVEHPAQLYTGSLVNEQVRAIATGSRPLSYAWNFAGGSLPNIYDWSTANHTVAVTPVDTYPADSTEFPNAKLCALNAYGADQLSFSLVVEQPASFNDDELIFWGEPLTSKVFEIALRSGSLPLHFTWSFDGGAIDDVYSWIVTDNSEPMAVPLGDFGKYSGNVTVENTYTDPANPPSKPFKLFIGVPQVVSVNPLVVDEYTWCPFAAEILGDDEADDLDTVYEWNFGDGATPEKTNLACPQVSISASGIYLSTLTIDNKYGTDKFAFLVHALPLPPESITASDGECVDMITLNWPGTSSADGYILRYRNISGGAPIAWTELTTITKNVTMYTHSSTEPAGKAIDGSSHYEYQVKSFNDSLESANWSPSDSGYPATVYGDWSMVGHDAQHTCQSIYIAAQTNELFWNYTTGREVYTPAVGADGTIYFGCFNGSHNNVYALNPDGSKKWILQVNSSVFYSPAISADGTILVSETAWLAAINPNGTVKWTYGGNPSGPPSIGSDGTIYIGMQAGLCALSQTGELKWIYEIDGSECSIPTIAIDGTVYASCTNSNLYALNPNGTLKWSYTAADALTSPAVGADDTVYVGCRDSNLYAFNPDGSLKWSYTLDGAASSAPAIGLDGTITIASYNSLYTFNPDGSLKRVGAGGSAGHLLALGADNTVYTLHNGIQAINPDNTIKWSYRAFDQITCDPVIGKDGTLYVGHGEGLAAFGPGPVQ